MAGKTRKKIEPAKGERIIWRKDRFIMSVFVLLLIISGLFLFCLGLCTVSEETPEDVPEYACEQYIDVIENAHRDAHKVLQTTEGSMERQHEMLNIKSRESQLRVNGLSEAADDYIGTVNKLLKKE